MQGTETLARTMSRYVCPAFLAIHVGLVCQRHEIFCVWLLANVHVHWHRNVTVNEFTSQEILEKAPQLPEDINWHFVGHLQSNKAKSLLGEHHHQGFNGCHESPDVIFAS